MVYFPFVDEALLIKPKESIPCFFIWGLLILGNGQTYASLTSKTGGLPIGDWGYLARIHPNTGFFNCVLTKQGVLQGF